MERSEQPAVFCPCLIACYVFVTYKLYTNKQCKKLIDKRAESKSAHRLINTKQITLSQPKTVKLVCPTLLGENSKATNTKPT